EPVDPTAAAVSVLASKAIQMASGLTTSALRGPGSESGLRRDSSLEQTSLVEPSAPTPPVAAPDPAGHRGERAAAGPRGPPAPRPGGLEGAKRVPRGRVRAARDNVTPMALRSGLAGHPERTVLSLSGSGDVRRAER